MDYINSDNINSDYTIKDIPGLKYDYLTDNTSDNIIATFYSLLTEAD